MSMELLEGESEAARDYGLERLAMLSDGVFAIAMTLLALELKAPDGWDGTIADLFARSHGQFGAFVTSFGLSSMYWIYHRRTFWLYRRSDLVLTLLNLVALGLLVLLPFVTRLYIAHSTSSGAVDLYLGELAAIGCALSLQWAWGAFIARLTGKISLAFRFYVFFSVLLMPVVMSGLGVVASRPGWGPAAAVIVVLAIAMMLLRRKFASDAPI
jgi:uncharacterized membrane protein